jgi:hypothetical protein
MSKLVSIATLKQNLFNSFVNDNNDSILRYCVIIADVGFLLCMGHEFPPYTATVNVLERVKMFRLFHITAEQKIRQHKKWSVCNSFNKLL